MNNIVIFGRSYALPSIKDERFLQLQGAINAGRERIASGEKPKGLAALFARREVLGPEERLRLMEELTEHYDELITVLKEKIEACHEVFSRIGEGVKAEFSIRLAELEATEKRRLQLIDRIAASGWAEAAEGMAAGGEDIRGMVKDLSRSTILIVRKLRHALDALETLASDEEGQRKVYEKLKSDVGLYREVYQFQKELRRLEAEIAKITQVALSFDSILRDNLGPLSVLIEEISKVDSRLGESLTEIERLSVELEKGRSAALDRSFLPDRFMDILIAGRMRTDTVAGIIEVLADPLRDCLDSDFEVSLAGAVGGASVDFAALAENMGDLVRRGLEALPALTESGDPVVEPNAEVTAPAATTVKELDEVMPPESAPTDEIAAAAVSGTTEDKAEIGAAATTPGADQETGPPAEPAVAPYSAGSESTRVESLWVPPPPRDDGATPGGRVRASYSAAISRTSPTLLFFLLDRSGSMDATFAGGLSRAAYLAQEVDSAIQEIAVRCNKADGLRDYFHIAALGYGNGKVENAFDQGLASSGAGWCTISEVVRSPLAVDRDPGGLPKPRWIVVKAEGDTPMKGAMEAACRLTAAWCDTHPHSYPPTVINITDGEPTGESPESAAGLLRRIHTEDGETLLFNLHISERGRGPVVFPDSDTGLDDYGKLLYRMSSPFPPHLRVAASVAGFSPGPSARFFAYGASADLVFRLLDLGTRPGKLA